MHGVARRIGRVEGREDDQEGQNRRRVAGAFARASRATNVTNDSSKVARTVIHLERASTRVSLIVVVRAFGLRDTPRARVLPRLRIESMS